MIKYKTEQNISQKSFPGLYEWHDKIFSVGRSGKIYLAELA